MMYYIYNRVVAWQRARAINGLVDRILCFAFLFRTHAIQVRTKDLFVMQHGFLLGLRPVLVCKA